MMAMQLFDFTPCSVGDHDANGFDHLVATLPKAEGDRYVGLRYRERCKR
jgi:hypothetical protein